MAKKKKPLSPPAKLALAKAEHTRASKALDKAAQKLDACHVCNETKLERELEVLAKRHGKSMTSLKKAMRGENSAAPKKVAKKRKSKKRAKAAAPAAPAAPKKASKKRSSKKKASKKASKAAAPKKTAKRGKKAAKKASKK